MQLTDQTVAAALLSCRSGAAGAGFVERRRGRICRRYYSSVAVSSFNRSSVNDEDEEQQAETALQVRVPGLECSHQHAGLYISCVRVLTLPNCTYRPAQSAISDSQIRDKVSRKAANA